MPTAQPSEANRSLESFAKALELVTGRKWKTAGPEGPVQPRNSNDCLFYAIKAAAVVIFGERGRLSRANLSDVNATSTYADVLRPPNGTATSREKSQPPPEKQARVTTTKAKSAEGYQKQATEAVNPATNKPEPLMMTTTTSITPGP
jgi:hypothetical protein